MSTPEVRCSIQFGANVTTGPPGSATNVYETYLIQ